MTLQYPLGEVKVQEIYTVSVATWYEWKCKIRHWSATSREEGLIQETCVCVHVCMCVCVKVTQSCPTLCDPMDYKVPGIFQARIPEWVAFPFSRGSSQPRDWTQVSCIAGRFFTSWATRETCVCARMCAHTHNAELCLYITHKDRLLKPINNINYMFFQQLYMNHFYLSNNSNSLIF